MIINLAKFRWLIAIAVSAWLVAGWTQVAEACRCHQRPRRSEEAFEQAAVVFRGRVKQFHDYNVYDQSRNDAKASITVLESWKGGLPHGESVVIRTPAGKCCYRFVEEKEYLVYASRTPAGALETDICTRTRPVDEAKEDLVFLSFFGRTSRHGPSCFFLSKTHQPLLAGPLTEELMVNHNFVLASYGFSVIPSKGYPLTFLPGGELVTQNLGQLNAWWIRDNRVLELGVRDPEYEKVYYHLIYDEGCGTLVSEEPLGGEYYRGTVSAYLELNLAE